MLRAKRDILENGLGEELRLWNLEQQSYLLP